MKKNYFLSLLLVILVFNLNAQTGSIVIGSIPASTAAGATVSITLTYTSSVPCKITAQLRQTNANATTVNWGAWNGEVVTNLPAATNASVIISYPISASQAASTTLASGVSYTFAFKMSTTADVGFAWNDGATANLTNIRAAGIQNTANIISAPTTVAAGGSVVIDFNYTFVNAGKVKIDVRKYNGTAWLSTGLVAEAYIDPAAATTSTPMSGSKTLVIPGGTAMSSALTAGENYKIAVTLYDSSWTWILEKKSDLTITANLGVNDFELNEKITIVNPVGDHLLINYTNLNAQFLRISDISGRLVKSLNNLNNLKSIDVSELKQGVYFLTINNNKALKFIKN